MVVWWRRKLSWSWNPFQNILSHKKFIKSMCCVESTVDNGMQFKYCIVFLCHLSRSKSWWKDFLYKYWKYFFQSFCRKIFLPRRSILPAFILGLCPSSLQNQFKWQSPWCIYTRWVFPIVLWKLRISSFTWHHHPWIEFENVEKLTFYYLNLLELIWIDFNEDQWVLFALLLPIFFFYLTSCTPLATAEQFFLSFKWFQLVYLSICIKFNWSSLFSSKQLKPIETN